MIIIQFRKHLLHYGFAEEHSLRAHPEFLTIPFNGSHLTVVQIYHLPMLSHKRCLLLLQIFRIHTWDCFLTPYHDKYLFAIFHLLIAKVNHFPNILSTFAPVMIFLGKIFVRL